LATDTSARWNDEDKMKKNHKTIVVGSAAGLLALAGLFVTLSLTRSAPPAPQAATPEQTIEFLASDKFARMNEDDKRRYIRQIDVPDSRPPILSLLFRPGVSDEQRQRVMERILPVVGPLIDQRLDAFDRLPAAEQTARLDAIIDQMQQNRGDRPGLLSMAKRLNLVLQYIDPHTRAKVRQHMPALVARMQERNLSATGPF
jgi:hypothetical protein